MADPGSGLSGYLGVGEEATFGTAVAPTRYFEYLSESLDLTPGIVTGSGIRKGSRTQRADRRRQVTRAAAGDVSLEVPTRGSGLLWKHLLGAVATTQPDAVNSPTVYMHTFTEGDLYGKSLTVEKGVPQTDGTVQAFRVPGAKLGSFDLSIAVDSPLALQVGVDGRDVTAEAASTPSYPAGSRLFYFDQGTLKLDNVAFGSVTTASVTGTVPLATDRFRLGNSGRKSQQVENGFREYGGQLGVDFDAEADVVTRYLADTEFELVLEFVGDTIEDSLTDLLRVTLPKCYFSGQLAAVDGVDVVTLDAPFVALDGHADGPIKVELQTSESTP